jgi:hypothetical protein
VLPVSCHRIISCYRSVCDVHEDLFEFSRIYCSSGCSAIASQCVRASVSSSFTNPELAPRVTGRRHTGGGKSPFYNNCVSNIANELMICYFIKRRNIFGMKAYLRGNHLLYDLSLN